MKAIAKLLRPLETALNKLGICSTVGLMAGGITGFILFCYYMSNPVPVFSSSTELLQVAAMIWLFSFFSILFILVVFCRFNVGSVFYQTLINTALSSFATTYFVYQAGAWKWAFFTGIFIGLIIGRLLCLICKNIKLK